MIMKLFYIALILTGILLNMMSTTVFALPPIIRYNVLLLQNATSAQCDAAKNGRAQQEEAQSYSVAGNYSGLTGPGIRSCTRCTVRYPSHDCVCSTCYYYFN